MKLVSAALFLGLALVAAAIVYASRDSSGEVRGYGGYEAVAGAWIESVADRDFDVVITVERVERVAGPFYKVVFRVAGKPGQRCALVDVSTRWGDPSRLWTSWYAPAAACP